MSDRGVQYASHAYQEFLKDHGMCAGMSRKGNCWDNAVMERFFGTLKRECTTRARFATHEEARTALFEYIEAYYVRSVQPKFARWVRGWLARRRFLTTHDLMGDAISPPRGERGTTLPGGSDWSSIRQAGSKGKHYTQSERNPFRVRLPRRRQLKVHLNHRNFDQAKQADKLEPKR